MKHTDNRNLEIKNITGLSEQLAIVYRDMDWTWGANHNPSAKEIRETIKMLQNDLKVYKTDCVSTGRLRLEYDKQADWVELMLEV